MDLFLGRLPNDEHYFWKEWMVQAYIVQELRRLGHVVHGDGNGLSLSPKGMQQKTVTGALKGWPDLTVLLPRGVVVFIELKVESRPQSQPQKDLQAKMLDMGHNYFLVRAEHPLDGLEQVLAHINNVQARTLMARTQV